METKVEEKARLLFRETVRKQMMTRGMDITDLALRLGVNPSEVHRLLAGDIIQIDPKGVELAEALGLSLTISFKQEA